MKKMLSLVLSIVLSMLFYNPALSMSANDYPTHLSQEEFTQFSQKENTVVIDVRTVREYKAGYIPGAINIPHRDIIAGRATLDKYQDKDIIFYCHSGVRVGIVTDYLEQNPTLKPEHIFHLKGDFRAWRARGKEIIKP